MLIQLKIYNWIVVPKDFVEIAKKRDYKLMFGEKLALYIFEIKFNVKSTRHCEELYPEAIYFFIEIASP